MLTLSYFTHCRQLIMESRRYKKYSFLVRKQNDQLCNRMFGMVQLIKLQQIIIMSESNGLLNYQIAQIYDHMMNGDKSALFKLQHITHKPHPIKYAQSHNQQKPIHFNDNHLKEQIGKMDLSQSKVEGKEFKQVSSLPSMQSNKDQIFLNILKKGAKLDSNIILQKPRAQSKRFKRIVNSNNNQYGSKNSQQPIKQINLAKQIKPNLHNQVDFKINLDTSILTKNKLYALPKVNKVKQPTEMIKAQSTHIESKKNPQLENLQKSKMSIKKQKVNFQELIGKNKKMKEQFEKANMEERQLQIEIMQYHNKTKQFLQKIQNSYQISLKNAPKYLKRRQKQINEVHQSGQITESKSQKKISPFKTAMLSQAQKCIQIESQLAHLKNLCKKNQSTLKKLQRERETLLFARYLDRYGLQIQEQAQQEFDTVQPLLQNQPNQKQKYKYSMARTRQKKWSLIQRTQYQAQRTHSLEQSRKAHTTSRTTQQTQMRIGDSDNDQSKNKVIVNERLKNLLFS